MLTASARSSGETFDEMFGPTAEKVQGNKSSECTLSPFPPAWGGGEGGEGQKYHNPK